MNNGIIGQGNSAIATPYALLGGSSAPALPFGTESSRFALDIAPGATAAYSLRRLSSAYTGPVVRVRRSGTTAERDFTAEEVAAGVLAEWVGNGNFVFPSVGWSATDYVGNVFGVNNNPSQTTGIADPFGGNAAVAATWSDPTHRLGTRSDGFSNGNPPAISAPFTLSFWARVASGTATIKSVVRARDTNVTTDRTHTLTTTWTRFTHSSTWVAENGGSGFYFDNAPVGVPIEFYGFQLETGVRANDLVITTTQPTGIGLVVTWYDQSGAGRHLQPTSLSAAPFIAAGGYMVTRNGRPYIDFSFSRNLYRAAESFVIGSDSCISVGSRGSLTSGRGYFSTADADDVGFINFSNFFGWRGAGNLTYNPPTNVRELWSGAVSVGQATLYRRGAVVGFTVAPALNNRASWLLMSHSRGLGRPIDARIEELVYHAHGTDKRSALEADMAAYYGFTLAPRVNDPDAQAWVNNVYSVGSTVNAAVARAVNDFVVGCKTDGIWSAIKTACILCGADTLTGALVPLVGAAPTNFSFVSTDYNRLTGLAGNGSTKYLNTNRNANADPQDNFHFSFYLSANFSSPLICAGAGAADNGATQIQGNQYRCRNGSGVTPTVSMGTASLHAMSRSSSTEFIGRNGGVSQTFSVVSQTPFNGNLLTHARLGSAGVGLHSAMRISFYSIGESLDLALLDSRVSALVAAIGAASA